MTDNLRKLTAAWGVGGWSIGYGTANDGPWWLLVIGCGLLLYASTRPTPTVNSPTTQRP